MEAPTLTDADLLRRHLAGDPDAFGTLRARYAGLVYGVCRRTTGDATLAEDAAQGVFLLLSQKARSLSEHPALAGWLFRSSRLVAGNVLREEGRRKRRERRAFTPPESEAGWAEVAPAIDAALARLGEGDREAILLRYIQDLPLAQVGAVLGVGENTARMRVSRAVERLRDRLQKAGVAVSAAVLATLLSTRMAEASPIPFGEMAKPSSRVRQAVSRARWMLSLAVLWKPVAVASVAGALAIGSAAWFISEGGKNAPPEVVKAFAAASGGWKGKLEYADDRTGVHNSYPATVRVSGDPSRLTFTARYEGSSRVDETVFVQNGDIYCIENGGATSSHVLDGDYRAAPLPDGTLEFRGRSTILSADVRLSLKAAGDSLTLQEEFRRPGDADYRFRNRFDLRREDGGERLRG